MAQNIERVKCITMHQYIMTKEFRDKKDDKPTNKNLNEMPSLKDYKSKEE
jgi:hypothetical protein